MPIRLALLRANVVDEQKDLFTEAALQKVADDWQKNPIVRTVARNFTPAPRAVGRVLNVEYGDGTLWVELDDDAKKIVESEGLEAAAGGYFTPAEPDENGVRTIEVFLLERVAIVSNKVK